MTCGNITLEIFVNLNHPERVNSPEAKGLRHVAVTVDKIEDLNMEIEEIRIDWFGRRFTFIGDSGIIGTTKKNLDFTRVSMA